MAIGTLPADSIHIVRNRGGGPNRSYLKVQPTIISPAQQVVNQAQAKVADTKPVNRGKRRLKPAKISTGRGIKRKHRSEARVKIGRKLTYKGKNKRREA